ncbi:Integrase%2C catalytic region [Yersinia enterocolitica]|nr:Integrase%2C catalytic region [Yersinia enterocolitica]
MAWFWQQDYNQNRTHESLGHLPPEHTENSQKTLNRFVSDNGEWTFVDHYNS